jgi:hypothetical protein
MPLATATAAGWCAECVTISTSSGLRWSSVMASDVASSAGGIWSSVLMCAGTSADGSGSCTLRSKMSDDAGLCRPGEGMRRLGDVPIGSMRGLPRGDARRSGGDMGGEGSSAGAIAPASSFVCLPPSLPLFLFSPRSFFPFPRRLFSLVVLPLGTAGTDVDGLG